MKVDWNCFYVLNYLLVISFNLYLTLILNKFRLPSYLPDFFQKYYPIMLYLFIVRYKLLLHY